MMLCHTQAGNITNNLKVKIDLTSPELSAKKIVTWNCHADSSSKGRYDMVLSRYIVIALGSNKKISKHIIQADYGHLKASSSPMVNLGMYEFKYLNTGGGYTRSIFTNAYSEEIHEKKSVLLLNNYVKF